VLKDKKILIGVTGSIAAYKAAFLIRMLVREGAEVRVVMTDLAKAFITPLTLATLSRNPVLTEFYDPENGNWNNHVDLGSWADAYLIAPATANTIAKMAHGVADNLLLTTYLSARCPVFVAPAMDLDMFRHAATQENLKKLSGRGHIIIEPSTGELASGLEGKGRMEEPGQILKILSDYYKKASGEKKNSLNKLKGKQVLITAGPTYEKIDPVRFIGNHSSGKMGYAIAALLAKAGAKVCLVSGPTGLDDPAGVMKKIDVQTAEEMYRACTEIFSRCDIAILAAAVADYKPSRTSRQKIKSQDTNLNLQLEKTVDIASELGKRKGKGQLVVGFALETEQELENAKMKLQKKNLDMIVLNSLQDKGAGFGHDTNKITIIDRDNKIVNFGLKEKSEVAFDILQMISEKLQ
jgi:phosphopantothenoylcysteine decarboxylase/phosphopantothenate--cysteine ligase